MRTLFSMLPLLLVVAACAPTVTGSSPNNPVVIQEGRAVEVEQGSVSYLSVDYSFDELGLEPRDLSGALWIPAGVDADSANMSTRVSLRDVLIPAGWQFELAEVRAYRETESRFGRETGTSYSVVPVYMVSVPADADLGVTEIRASLNVRDGDRQSLEIPVRVRAPAD